MECCRKGMTDCNMPDKEESCCHPDRTADASVVVTVPAKQKLQADGAGIVGSAALSPPFEAHLPGIAFPPGLPPPPLPHQPLVKPLRI
jgi:hypothetical protein